MMSILLLFGYFLAISSSQQSHEEMYKNLFKRRRAEQLESIRHIQKFTIEKKDKIINITVGSIFSTIEKSRIILENAGFVPGLTSFPDSEKERDALSNILENTAFFGEMVLRFPDTISTVLAKNNSLQLTYQWCITFCELAKDLLDKSTIKLLNLVSQELNYIDREEDFENPYRTRFKKTEVNVDVPKQVKKRKKLKKGPRIHSEL